MTIIDTHAHIYPDAIALKAAASIGKFYDIPMDLDGTVDTFCATGIRRGLTAFWCSRCGNLGKSPFH